MSIINKFTENLNREFNTRQQKSEFRMPAVTRDHNDSISILNAIIVSLILHPVMMFVFWLVVFILASYGIHLTMFDKPKPHINDIEFVLVEKEETPKNKDTKFRSDRNSRAGGINDPKKPVSLPSAQPSKPANGGSSAAPKQPVKQPSPAPKQAQKTKQQKQTPSQSQAPAPKKQEQKAVTTTNKNVTPAPEVTEPIPKPKAAKPAPPSAKPSIKPPSNPKATAKPTDTPFKNIVPPGGKTTGSFSTGPVGGSGTATNGGSSGSGKYAPNPSLAPTGNGSGSKIASSGSGKTGTGSGTGGSGYGSGSGNGGGNPAGGGGRPGIDTIREADFGPYMRELTRKIKMTWEPPKGNESKRVVLLFKIAKNGQLLSVSVFKSSGLQNVDQAAINAVKTAAPFRQLPPEFKGANIDIQFTFDYNVYGHKM